MYHKNCKVERITLAMFLTDVAVSTKMAFFGEKTGIYTALSSMQDATATEP